MPLRRLRVRCHQLQQATHILGFVVTVRFFDICEVHRPPVTLVHILDDHLQAIVVRAILPKPLREFILLEDLVVAGHPPHLPRAHSNSSPDKLL